MRRRSSPVAAQEDPWLRGRMMAWQYLRAAVLQRWRLPMVGELPVNLAALGIFGVMGLDNPAFWAAGGVFETVWLTLTAGRAGYRRQVDATRRRRLWKAVEERRLALYNQLPPEPKRRHHALRAACRELVRSPREADPEATAEVFTWLHLKLLLAREVLAAGRETVPDEDLHRLQAQSVLDVPEPAAACLAEHAISLLETRRRHDQESGQRLAHIDRQILQIEEEIRTAGQRNLRDRTEFDFQHSLSLARDRLREDLAAIGEKAPVAEVETLLADLTVTSASKVAGSS